MRVGICADLLKAQQVASAGFDYIEGSLVSIALATDKAFETIVNTVQLSNLKAEALNCMLPGELRLTGPDASLGPIQQFLEKGFARAQRLGVQVQVFGSGAARQVPAGWPVGRAFAQLADFLTMAAPIAARHGISIVVEPLNPGECNIINTVAEAFLLARQVNLTNVGVLADWYHMAVQREGIDGMLATGRGLLHCHIANPAGRRFPLPCDSADFSLFTGALRELGYTGRVSVEGNGNENEYAAANLRIKECFNAAV